jgi:hypothetical protein
MEPAKRSVIGMFGVLALIAVWAVIVASFANQIARLWFPVQMLVYVAAGLVWIFPAMPIMRWIVTGRFRS